MHMQIKHTQEAETEPNKKRHNQIRKNAFKKVDTDKFIYETHKCKILI